MKKPRRLSKWISITLALVIGIMMVPNSFLEALAYSSPTPQATAGDGSVTLSWNAVPGAAKYAIAYQKGHYTYNNNNWTNAPDYNNNSSLNTQTTYTVTNLVAQQEYTLIVQAYVNVNGSWGWTSISNYAYATPTGATKPTVTATAGDGSVTLSWNAVSGATKYVIQYWDTTIQDWHTCNNTWTDTTYTVPNLIAGKTYKFLVQSNDGDKWSSYGESDCVTATPTGNTRPATTVTQVGKNSVTLSWGQISGATKYVVQYLQDDGSWHHYEVSSTTFTCQTTGLTTGKLYTFLVQAYLDGNWSSYTTDNYVTAKPFDIQRPVVLATAGDGRVTLSWSPVPNATKYTIAYQGYTTDDTSNNWNNIDDYNNNSNYNTQTTYTVTDLVASKQYTFVVQAYVNGSWSQFNHYDYAHATPFGAKKPSVTVTGVGDSSVTLSWNAVSGADKYAVYYKNGTSWIPLNENVSGTSYPATGLTNHKSYTFLVQSHAGGDWSSYVSDDYVTATPVDIKRPVVQATAGNGSVTLNWAPIEGATSYAIAFQPKTSQGPQAGCWTTRTSSCTDTTYTINSIPNSTINNYTEYYIVVQAYFEPANGTPYYSNFDSTDCVVATPHDLSIPFATATVGVSKSVTLTWDPVQGATQYAVAYKSGHVIDNNTNDWHSFYNITDTTYTISGSEIDNHQEYTFLVQACVGGQWTAINSTYYVWATPYDANRPVVHTAAGDGNVTLTWDEIQNATSYRVGHYDYNNNFQFSDAFTGASHTTDDLISGRTYTFVVQAMVNGSWSSYDTTDYVRATPTGATHPKPTIDLVGNGSVTLSWNKVSGATQYKIYYRQGTLEKILGDGDLQNNWLSKTNYCTTSPTTTITIDSLSAGNTYTFLVQANFPGDSNSSINEQACVTTNIGKQDYSYYINVSDDYKYLQKIYPDFVVDGSNIGCQATAIATGVSIATGQIVSPLDYWDITNKRAKRGPGIQVPCNTKPALQQAYDDLKLGMPTNVHIYDPTLAPLGHWVTIIGVKAGAVYDNLSVSNFEIIDPGAKDVPSAEKPLPLSIYTTITEDYVYYYK